MTGQPALRRALPPLRICGEKRRSMNYASLLFFSSFLPLKSLLIQIFQKHMDVHCSEYRVERAMCSWPPAGNIFIGSSSQYKLIYIRLLGVALSLSFFNPALSLRSNIETHVAAFHVVLSAEFFKNISTSLHVLSAQ